MDLLGVNGDELLQHFSAGAMTVVGGLVFLACLAALVHAVSFKRDARSAALWVLIILFSPVIGVVFYVLFGLNRIDKLKQKARRLRAKVPSKPIGTDGEAGGLDSLENLPSDAPQLWKKIIPLGNRVAGVPVYSGNQLRRFSNSREAYPAMTAAIDRATKRVWLQTYIFDLDQAGLQFADALGRAVARGVDVRVLIDALGSHYSFPSIRRALSRRKIRYSLFLPVFSFTRFSIQFLNLRNHRKLLLCDDDTAFTGGMNLRLHPTRDMHLEVKGPIFRPLEELFIDDWSFASGERLKATSVFKDAGGVIGPETGLSRVLVDGPDVTDYRVLWMWLQAIHLAEREVQIQTPYFIPDAVMISALSAAAMRGVSVKILLPGKNNLPWVGWATQSLLWQLLKFGVQVRYSNGDFDHGKWFCVDGVYSVVGSSNWDPRSWRLNFELNLEVFDLRFARNSSREFLERFEAARAETLASVDSRPLPIRFRDGFARLFSPLL